KKYMKHMQHSQSKMQNKIDENLSTPQGKEMKRQRSIQLEGVFGLLKQDIEYTQIRRRGIQNVKKRYI
ncbi:MAG: transposase, partial [Coprobacillus cateniformis]